VRPFKENSSFIGVLAQNRKVSGWTAAFPITWMTARGGVR
jgi:hypothetical protein